MSGASFRGQTVKLVCLDCCYIQGFGICRGWSGLQSITVMVGVIKKIVKKEEKMVKFEFEQG